MRSKSKQQTMNTTHAHLGERSVVGQPAAPDSLRAVSTGPGT